MVLRPDPSGERRLLGTSGSDLVFLSSQQMRDFPLGVFLLEGDDTVYGSFGDDIIFGNQGDDFILGSGGQDLIFGGQGGDLIYGELGDDTLFGNTGDDILVGGEGNDVLYGGAGNDILYGDQGNNTLSGDQGRDFLIGSLFDNLFSPSLSNNLYILEVGSNAQDINDADVITGFKAGDQFGLTGSVTADDLILEPIQNVVLSMNFEFSPLVRESFDTFGILPLFTGEPFISSGTLIRTESTGNIIAFVEAVTPEDLQGSFISID